MPWDGKKEICELYPKTVQRGATNVYFPKIESSIVIPPYSEQINIDIENSNAFSAFSILLNNAKEK